MKLAIVRVMQLVVLYIQIMNAKQQEEQQQPGGNEAAITPSVSLHYPATTACVIAFLDLRPCTPAHLAVALFRLSPGLRPIHAPSL